MGSRWFDVFYVSGRISESGLGARHGFQKSEGLWRLDDRSSSTQNPLINLSSTAFMQLLFSAPRNHLCPSVSFIVPYLQHSVPEDP